MQNDLGISVEASVEAKLDAPTPVYIGPAPSGEQGIFIDAVPAQHAQIAIRDPLTRFSAD